MEWPGQDELNNTPLREWYVDDVAAGKTRSSGNFTFATIYGAGHLVRIACADLRYLLKLCSQAPHDKPIESLALLNRWIADKEL